MEACDSRPKCSHSTSQMAKMQAAPVDHDANTLQPVPITPITNGIVTKPDVDQAQFKYKKKKCKRQKYKEEHTTIKNNGTKKTNDKLQNK